MFCNKLRPESKLANIGPLDYLGIYLNFTKIILMENKNK
jgi:hypothetical protein